MVGVVCQVDTVGPLPLWLQFDDSQRPVPFSANELDRAPAEPQPARETCKEPDCADGMVPTMPDGEPGPCPACASAGPGTT